MTVEKNIIKRILNSVDVLIYGITYDTFEIIEGNWKVKERFPAFQPGKICYELLHGRSEPCENCPMARARKLEEDVGISLSFGEEDQWLQVMFNDFVMDDGEHICLCTGMDITGVKESVRMTENVLNGIHAAAYSVGARDYRLHSLNSWLKELLPEAKEGDLCYQVLWDQDKPCGHCPISKLSHKNPSENMKMFNQKLDRYLSIDSVLVRGVAGDNLVVFTGYDITRQVEYERRLQNLAFQDTLTGLKNRAAFMEALSERYCVGGAHYVCAIHIKNFSPYNLAYGRIAGDELLKSFSLYFSTFYGSDRLYRISGGKFALIADTDEDRFILEKILSEPVPPVITDLHKNFRFYIGSVILEIPQFASSPELVMHRLEYMLRKHKNLESNDIAVFNSIDQKELERRSQISSILRRTIKEKSLMVYYQPIYSIGENSFTKCEALARLHDEELGWISPVEFIPIAEECGLIHELGALVLDMACGVIERRMEAGLPPVQINVNVSTVQFSSQDFYDTVMEILDRHAIDRALIHLEVTENIMINSLEYIVDIMNRLISQGVKFAVDDFGTGYSSLSYIGTLPVEGIKLDKSFIDRIAKSEAYLMIVKNVVEIAKGLHFKIVAEGVEDLEQFQLLKGLGCDYIQGYLFSKPLPERQFEYFLEKLSLDHSPPRMYNSKGR